MIDRLFVIWRHPSQGTRHVIGELRREDSTFAFRYADELPTADGFALLTEFPQRRTVFRERYLFPTFAQRVPSPSRRDRDALLRAWGVQNPDDALEVLARSGGIQATDRIELAEFRAEDDQLRTPLEMRVAGATHYGAPDLDAGDPIQLEREPTNAYDPHATVVLLKGKEKIGYVPRQYARFIATLLDGGARLRAETVRKLVLPPEGGRWVIRVSRAE